MKLADLLAAGVVPVWDGGGLLRPLSRYTAQGSGGRGTVGDDVARVVPRDGPNVVMAVKGGGGPFGIGAVRGGVRPVKGGRGNE